MLARSTILGLALLGVLVPAGLHGCKETPEQPEQVGAVTIASTYEIQPIVVGKAGFVETGGGDTLVKLFLRGTDTKPPGSSARLEKIQLFGAPGRKGAEELGIASHLVHEVNGPALPKRDWELTPKDLPRDKMTIKLADLGGAARLGDYSLLLRLTYRSGDVEELDRIGLFSSWGYPARALDLNVPAPQPGDDITHLGGKGTFFGAEGIALYDFDVEFDGTAVKVEAYAGRANAPGWPASHHLIYSQTFTGLTGELKVNDVVGRYNSAYDEYWFRVEVTELKGTPPVATLVPPKQGTYTDIIANQGVLIAMDE